MIFDQIIEKSAPTKKTFVPRICVCHSPAVPFDAREKGFRYGLGWRGGKFLPDFLFGSDPGTDFFFGLGKFFKKVGFSIQGYRFQMGFSLKSEDQASSSMTRKRRGVCRRLGLGRMRQHATKPGAPCAAHRSWSARLEYRSLQQITFGAYLPALVPATTEVLSSMRRKAGNDG